MAFRRIGNGGISHDSYIPTTLLLPLPPPQDVEL